MLGAITAPGIYNTDHEKLTILEAIAMAGDLSPNGKRENIMVVRQKGDGKEYGFVDITSKSIMTSPYYNLHTDDIIYVEPTLRSRLNGLEPYFAVFGIVVGALTLTILLVNK
jgi:polysaccharide export outer membrane protein